MVSCFVSPEMSECLIDAHLTQMGGCPCIRLVNLSPISPLSTAELTDTMTIKYFQNYFIVLMSKYLVSQSTILLRNYHRSTTLLCFYKVVVGHVCSANFATEST